jgi:5'-methylthioadenosine phosphorylase
VSEAAAELGVIGGSGFYALLDEVDHVELDTPWGPPSGPVAVGEVGGRRVAFLPRHGPAHELPPHRINARANLWALRSLGVRRVLGPCAAGSLQLAVEPGHVVVADQLVDRTWGRADTFFDGPVTNHVAFADPYCPELRSVALAAARDVGLPAHDGGTVVVIQGPRFSTRAESAWFRAQGWHLVNMTQYPEAFLARELGLCYATVALVTDYDTGVDGADHEPVTQEQVFTAFARNLDRVRALVLAALPRVPAEAACGCAAAPGGLEPAPPAPPG